MESLSAVLIGCGAIAREHLGAIAELKNVDVLSVCDLSPARAEATAERFGIKNWCTNYADLIASVRPDLVHITTPPSSHFEIARACLDAGLNVLCEKPIALDFQQFRLLKHLAVEKNCLLLENQNLRFHSSVRKILDLIRTGQLGDVLDVQISLALNIVGPDSPFMDRHARHPVLALKGGAIGDFLPHISYLAYIFIGKVSDLRTVWWKRTIDAPFADEFRGLVKGERATAYVSFSGNAQPNGFWVSVSGTKMQVAVNLFEPPRCAVRRQRSGEPAVMTMVDGIAEARDTFFGSITGFWRKLAGTSSYDGLPAFIAQTYYAIESGKPPPMDLEELEETVKIVDRFAAAEFRL